MENISASKSFEPWNKNKLVGQKAPLKLKEIWAIAKSFFKRKVIP
jgi:hypothetical protein